MTGLGVGALVGGPVGAAVGGAVGATGGWAMPEGADTLAMNAIHKEKTAASRALNDVGLGASSGSSQPSQGRLVRNAQKELQREGLYRGPVDGIIGPDTKQAIAAYQAREGLQQTATLDRDTLQRMNLANGSDRMARRDRDTASSGTSTPMMMSADEIRDRLQSAGYTNVSNVRALGQRYTAQAQRGDEAYALRIDGRTGQVISEQRVATNSAGSIGANPGSTSTSTDTGAGGAGNSRR
ncbi:MAG TPA: peptidoglycan-binding domain-containing protein [Stellaceae bacterium]